MTQETDTIEHVVEDAAPAVPPAPPAPPTAAAPPIFVMAKDELFSREQYIAAGWTDDQLVQAGKMHSIAPPPVVEMTKPVGMPESKWIVLDDNDDIPPTGLFLGHNGLGFLIQTGVPAYVPTYILGVLDDAIMEAPIIDPKTRQVVGYRPRPRYTYREVPEPTDA